MFVRERGEIHEEVCVCLFVCVCVRERGGIHKEVRVFVSVCVYVFVSV